MADKTEQPEKIDLRKQNSGRRSVVAEKESEEAYILYTRSRAKEMQHKAKLAEFKEKEVKQETLSARQVQLHASKAARIVHDSFMAFPDRVASLLVGRSEAEIMEELRREIKSTLETVADTIDGKT